ncbi:MAG: DUF4270 domain-containing protein [Paramuribaculum sp.]|nr:DUF4270 domain-containing protein [Paramuribaculum sp.]
MNTLKTLLTACAALATTAMIGSCDDTVTTLGSSLVTDDTKIIIDSSFQLTGEPIVNNTVQSRTTTQLIGSLTAKEYGSFASDFVSQFMSSMSIDTTGVALSDIDSVKLYMFFLPGALTGDSLVPMGLKVYPLTKQLPSPIYSDFDPTGYYDESNCWTRNSQIYTGNALYSDSANALSYRTVSVKLPLEFAQKVYTEYKKNPSTFATPDAFCKFFPGLYIKNTFGSGRVINFSQSRINFYYRKHGQKTVNGETRDTIINTSSTYMAVTPEVITNNIISMTVSDELHAMASRREPILVAPAAYDVKLTFPAPQIIAAYRRSDVDMSVINTLTMSIPVEQISNGYNINPPANVLLVLARDKDAFFAGNKITDDKTSFLAAYNSETKSYEFTGMRSFLLDLLEKGNITADDYTFILTPVDVTTETSSSGYYTSGATYITGINPYVSGPAMCRLNLADAKIKFTYSLLSVNN